MTERTIELRNQITALVKDDVSDEKIMEMQTAAQEVALNVLAEVCHSANKNWWIDLETGEVKQRNVGELLMLCVSELSEAMESHRKNLMDDKLPHRKGIEVEIADCFIRLFDLCAGLKLDIGGAFVEKMHYNAHRADHKIENRKLPGGKAY